MPISERDSASLITHALARDTLSRLRSADMEQVAFRKGLVKLGRICGYEIIDGSTVAVQFTVERSDPCRAAACVVRGRSRDGGETGRREILIPADSAERIGVRTEVTTSKPPVIGEVFGCTLDVPAYLKPSAS